MNGFKMCSVCHRIDVQTTPYQFGEKKFIAPDICSKEYSIKPNPRYLKVHLCVTDQQQISKLRRQLGPRATPRQVLDRAIKFRQAVPIQENMRREKIPGEEVWEEKRKARDFIRDTEEIEKKEIVTTNDRQSREELG